jgi:hypothetical protein
LAFGIRETKHNFLYSTLKPLLVGASLLCWTVSWSCSFIDCFVSFITS